LIPALKYHPDRNPGREEEVNSKFQTIQAAHEVLTDPEQRAKYDSGRSRGSRQPGFGGGSTFQTGGHQRGNPYSNAGSYWPPPPKPPPAKKAAPASAGAQRYAGFAQTGAGPSKREQDSAQARQKTYEAWENMRKKKPEPAREWTPPKPVPKEYTPQSGREESNSYRHSAPPKPRPGYEEFVPGPSPSRTQSTFRKNGYMPSNSGGDEPAAASASAYYTRAVPRPPTARVPDPPPRAAPIPVDPLKQFREKTGTPLEPRISTPYATHGGERTNPFESANLNRSKSTRENMDKGDPFSGSSDRHRSASPNRSKSQTHLAPEFGQTRAGSETHLGSPPKRFYSHASGGPKPTDGSRANDQYTNVEIDTSSSEDSSPEQKGESFGTRPRAYAKRRNARPTSQTAPVSKTATGEANASTSKPTLAEFRRWWSSDQPEGPEGYEKEILRNTPADGPGSRNPPDESKEDPKLYALSSNPFKFGTARSSTLPTVSEEPPIQKSPCPHSTFVPTSLFPTTSSGDFDVKWPYLFRGTSRLPDYGISDVPSGASLRHTTSLNAFESTQFDILDQLVSRNASNPTSNRGKPCRDRGVEPCSSDHITQEARGFLRKEVPKASSYLPGNPSLSERQDCLSSSSRVAVTSSKKPKFGEPSLSFPEKTGQCYNSDKSASRIPTDFLILIMLVLDSLSMLTMTLLAPLGHHLRDSPAVVLRT
jgi:curved DNA-binding protein CbpA